MLTLSLLRFLYHVPFSLHVTTFIVRDLFWRYPQLSNQCDVTYTNQWGDTQKKGKRCRRTLQNTSRAASSIASGFSQSCRMLEKCIEWTVRYPSRAHQLRKFIPAAARRSWASLRSATPDSLLLTLNFHFSSLYPPNVLSSNLHNGVITARNGSLSESSPFPEPLHELPQKSDHPSKHCLDSRVALSLTSLENVYCI